MAYTKKIWKDYPDATTPILASDMNNIEDGLETVDTLSTTTANNVNNGWIALNGTFAYSSADSPTFVMSTSVDLTGIVGLGMRIKLTQATTKYFIVTAITSNSITMYGGTDYTLTNTTVSNVYYSMLKAPYGFPINEAKWSIIVTDTTNRSQVTSGTTIYNLGGINITIPIGLWKVKYKGLFQIGSGDAASNAKYMTISLSTANNTINADNAIGIAGADIKFNRLYSEKTIDNLLLTSNMTYYLNVRDDAGGGNIVYFLNSNVGGLTLVIQAVCGYL